MACPPGGGQCDSQDEGHAGTIVFLSCSLIFLMLPSRHTSINYDVSLIDVKYYSPNRNSLAMGTSTYVIMIKEVRIKYLYLPENQVSKAWVECAAAVKRGEDPADLHRQAEAKEGPLFDSLGALAPPAAERPYMLGQRPLNAPAAAGPGPATPRRAFDFEASPPYPHLSNRIHHTPSSFYRASRSLFISSPEMILQNKKGRKYFVCLHTCVQAEAVSELSSGDEQGRKAHAERKVELERLYNRDPDGRTRGWAEGLHPDLKGRATGSYFSRKSERLNIPNAYDVTVTSAKVRRGEAGDRAGVEGSSCSLKTLLDVKLQLEKRKATKLQLDCRS